MTSILGRDLPRAFRILLLCLMAAIPVGYVLRSYSAETKFSRLVCFGSDFIGRALPPVRACSPATTPETGYDGQFYCQIATDPLLRNRQALQDALDAPAYRATRILLPWLAYVGGLGEPCAIIQTYALLNLGFWFLLLFGMNYFLKPRTIHDFLCVFATVMTSGALLSLHRAVTDLPAATLAFYAASLSGTGTVVAAMAMLLTKETYVFALPAVCWPARENRGRVAVRLAVILAPLAAWYLYAHLRLGFTGLDANISWPGIGLGGYLARAWRDWHPKQILDLRSMANLLAPMSLIVQATHLLVRRDTVSPYWRMGFGFVFVYLLDTDMFDSQVSFTRVLIPLTVTFNIAMMKERGWQFALWFVAGNTGLYWGLWKTLVVPF